ARRGGGGTAGERGGPVLHILRGAGDRPACGEPEQRRPAAEDRRDGPIGRGVVPTVKHREPMRSLSLLLTATLCGLPCADELESRHLTHYVPQDLQETAVRKGGGREVPRAIRGGVHRGDPVRTGAGGSTARGNGAQPAQHVNAPAGPDPAV